jgi:hypothetical protein
MLPREVLNHMERTNFSPPIRRKGQAVANE